MISVKKKLRKPSAVLSVILSVLMLLSVCPVVAFAAYPVEYYYPDGTQFVSAIAFSRKDYFGSLLNINDLKEKLNDAGYNAFDNDFNKGCGTGSDWIAGGWKMSTDITQALRDIKYYFSNSSSAPQYLTRTVNGRTVTYYLVGGSYEPNSVSGGGVIDLNGNAGGAYIWAYVTRDPAAGPPITGLLFNFTQNETGRGYTACTRFDAVNTAADLNDGQGDASYMHWTTNSSVVSTANLQSVYSLAQNMVPNRTNYTSDTYRALETAYNEATPVVDTFNANGAASITQSRINELYTNLYNAVYGAQTNVYFNASNNGGTTSAKSTTVTIGPASEYTFDVSSFTATKGNWNFLGWNINKDATSGSKTTVKIGFNSTLYAIYGKDVTTTFKYYLDDGSVTTEIGAGTIYNTAIAADVAAPSVNDVTVNGEALAFEGWRDDITVGAPEFEGTVPVKDGITYIFRAVYSIPVEISFDSNGGDSAAPEALQGYKYYNCDENAAEGSAEFTLPADVLSKEGYGFIGWSEDKDAAVADYAPGEVISGVKSDMLLYAVWSQNSYPVVFKNYDGEVLYETEVLHGEMPEYKGETPVKEGTIDTKWVFDGWDKNFEAVTSAQEYTAQFHSATADYLVQFVNDDGTVLQESMVEYLGMPGYNGETPVKEKDAQYTYTFAGWDNELVQVEGAQVYKATYTATLNSYTVQFVNDDGTVLQEEVLDYGAVPSYKGEVPVKDEDAQYIYTFDKWDKAITEVTGETVYTATYKTQTKSYEIVFNNFDGTELYRVTLEYGKLPEYKGAVPKKDDDVSFRYNFVGWTPEISTVTGDATYTAVFQAATKQIIITFFNYDGNVLESKFVEYGSVPVYTGEAPVKNGNAQYSYSFTGWDREIEPATGRADYYAQYAASVNEYTVVFENYDGTVLQSLVLAYGEIPAYAGVTPERETDSYVYTFNGWNKVISAVTGDAVYTAVYTKVSAAYKIRFLDEDGTVLQEEFYSYGDVPVYNGAQPVKAYDNGSHYEFKGWNKELAAVTENTSYVAVYSAEAHILNEKVVAAPTCTGIGETVYSCDCGYSYTKTSPANGHRYEYEVEGETVLKVCSVCGDSTEVTGEEKEEVLSKYNEAADSDLCEFCGKYHYKYLLPGIGRISCFIARIFTFLADLFAGKL